MNQTIRSVIDNNNMTKYLTQIFNKLMRTFLTHYMQKTTY